MRPQIRKPWFALALLLLGGVALPVLLAGCAAIMHGTTQKVSLTSTPPGANVTIDTKSVGQTPVVSKLRRSDSHNVKIELAGYQPFETEIKHKLSGWFWGNLIFGGVIGMVIDATTGAMYKLSPEQIEATLKSQGVSYQLEKDQILIAVTLTPDPGWEKVGNLTPLGR